MGDGLIDVLGSLALISIVLLVLLLIALRVTVRYTMAESAATGTPSFMPILEALTNSPSRPLSDIRLYGEVEAIYCAMLEAIAAAQVSITMETYLFWNGAVARRFGEAFKAKARSGIPVKLLFDADGSRFLTRRFLKELQDSGCEVRLFRPFTWYQPVQYNHRTHRKLLVIDGKVGFIGGIGVADIWQGPPAWLETMARVEGAVVTLLQGAFFQNWVIAGGTLCLSERYFPSQPPEGRTLGMLTTSSPIWGDSEMRLLYFSAIAAAQKSLYLASPYFLPSADTSEALAAAASRGVDVRLLLPGPNNDKKLPYYASRRLYGPLLEGGVRLFEYQPSMMHAKIMLVDGRWVTLGSTNFDPRSFFLNSEANLSVEDKPFARETEAFFAQAFALSLEVHMAEWRQRGWKEHVTGFFGLLFKDQL